MNATLRSDATALSTVRELLAADGASGDDRTYAVLPSTSRPRYVVAVAARYARGAHVRPGAGGRRDAIVRALVRQALVVGAGRFLPGRIRVADGTASEPGLRRHLGLLLGRDDVDLAIALGAPRPNRKPVIQVIAGDGETVAWAKLGVDDHTDALVAHETEALTRIDPDGPLAVPRVLAAGTWRDHRLLVLAPLEMSESMEPLPLTAAVLEAIAGPLDPHPAGTGPWVDSLRRRAGDDPTVVALVDDLASRLGDRTWRFGYWHGDLAPWNATWEGTRLHAWDWERSTGPVPLGIDAVHNEFQRTALLGADPAEAAHGAAVTAGPVLVELGYRPDEIGLVVRSYLATLRVRYAEDARLGSLGPGARIAAAIDRDPTLGLEAHP